MDETLNELLTIIATLVERVEKLEEAKRDQDDINGLLTDQIVSIDNTARFAVEEIEHVKARMKSGPGGIDFSHEKLAKMMGIGSTIPVQR
jgi:hypothetical protein